MKEEEEWTYAMFDRAVNEEKKWADYLVQRWKHDWTK